MTEPSLLISILALLVSVATVMYTIIVGERDKARVRATSTYFEGGSGYKRCIRVRVVNEGRRPVILTMIGGNTSGEGWFGRSLGKDGKGLRLGEGERHEVDFEHRDLMTADPEGEWHTHDELWVEDALGRRVVVEGSKHNILKMLEGET
jgi:hypothetical protein